VETVDLLLVPFLAFLFFSLGVIVGITISDFFDDIE